MKFSVVLTLLLPLAVNGCFLTTCTETVSGTNIRDYNTVVKRVHATANQRKNPANRPIQWGRKKRDTGYGYQNKKPNQVIEHGKVIVMPPLGEAPRNAPQPGSKYGGARPETMPYVAAMAPHGTVPIAVYPPFASKPRYPTRCVTFSELTDYEEEDGYGNVPYHKPTYEGYRHKRQVSNETLVIEGADDDDGEDVEHILTKRESIFERFMNSFSRPRRPALSPPSSSSSYAPPPSSYDAPKPSYAPSTEPPVKVVYRKFGFVCEVTVSVDACYVGRDCDEYGKNLNQKPHSYGVTNSLDSYQNRGNEHYGQSDRNCQTVRSTPPNCNQAVANGP